MPETPVDLPEGAGDPSLRGLLDQLSGDARAFARAEADYIRAELGTRAALFGPALGMIAVAIVLVFGVLIALLIGLILALAPKLSALGATIAVTAAAILVAFILARIGVARLKSAFKPRDDQ